MSTLRELTAAILAASVSTAAASTAFAETKSTDTKAAGAMQTEMGAQNYGQIVSALKSGTEKPADWASEIAGLKTDAQVNIVKLSELKGQAAENASALDQVLADAQPDVDATHGAIEANADLTAALEAQNFTASDVVAVMIDGDSSATLIVDDRS